MKNLIALTLLLSPAFAFASTEHLVCENKKGSVIVVIQDLQSYNQADGSVKATASLLIVKYKGKKIGHRIMLQGERLESPSGGPYFDLSGSKGYRFVISGPASQSPSELYVSGKLIEVDCE